MNGQQTSNQFIGSCNPQSKDAPMKLKARKMENEMEKRKEKRFTRSFVCSCCWHHGMAMLSVRAFLLAKKSSHL